MVRPSHPLYQLPTPGSGVAGLFCAFLALAATAIAPAEVSAQTVVRQISQSTDDAEQYTTDNSMYLTSSDLELLIEDDCCGIPSLMVGLRFQNISIPQGAQINNATIQFQVDETSPNTAVTITITGEDTDDAATFTTTADDIGGRTETTASVDWVVPHWAAVDDEGVDQMTPDLSSIIQEIVDRGGWATGNDMVIMFNTYSGSGTRAAEAYDDEPSAAAQLSIEYTTEPTTRVDLTVTASTDDAEEMVSDGSVLTNGSYIDILETGGNDQLVGFRFQNLTVPQGATILYSNLQFNVRQVASDVSESVDIYGEDIDDAPTFTTTTNDISGRTTTTASVSWDIPHWPTVDEEGHDQRSPDIWSIIQEIVDRPGWSSGNDVVIIIENRSGSGTRMADSWDHDTAGAPKLSVDYTATPTQTISVSVNQSSDDAEQDVGDSSMFLTGSILELITNGGSDEHKGMRFRDIRIPAGATIASANIQFGVHTVQANTAIEVTFSGEDIDDAPTFTTTSNDIGARTATTATVDWSVPHWDTVDEAGADQLSPDLTTIVQEIVDRGGWTSGNDIVIMVKDKTGSGLRSPYSFDGSASLAPKLTIVFSWPFRSKATGNWSAASTWERHNGTSWVSATTFPTATTAKALTLRSPYNVTIDSGVGSSVDVDELTIDSGGTLTVDQKTIVVDGSGTDVTVAGTLVINASKEFNPSSTSTVSVTGTVTNSGTFNATETSTVTFASGSTYDHSQNGGAFPQTARTTWSSGSTAKVTGVTTTVPTELGDAFHHFIWNSASQTAALDLNAAISSIGGDLTITSTGSGTLSWVQSLNTNLTIAGNYVQTGGTFIYTDGTGTGTMSATDVSVTGGTLTLTTSTGTPTLDIDDDLVVSGGGAIDETGAGSATITFTGSAQQDVTAASGITDSIDITVNNTGGILLLSDLSAPADLTATSGDIDAGGYDIYVGADLTISTDLTNGAAVIFNGASGNQNVTYSPGTWSIPSLDINKAAGSLLLGTDVTVTTTSCLTSGTLDVNGQTLTFPTGTTLYNGGTVTGNVVFERNYALVGDGWRMIASPLDGVNYSSLNTNFHTQGATWADFSGGSATLQSADFAAQDWTEITGADANFTAAEGYIFYMYEELLGSTILPATWSVTGTVRTSANKSLSWNTVSTDSYNYVGNRTTGNIDWDAAYAASTNVATTYSTWDPALTAGGGLTGYKYYNEATGTGLAGRYIAPFTAFMVEPTASGGTLVFSTSCADNEASANYFGKRAGGLADSTAREISPHVRLMVEGEGRAELETYLVFDDRATDGADPFDGNRMRPLSRDYVTLVSIQEDRSLVFDGRSMVEGTQEYTLGVAATQPGVYTLTWPDWHEIPEDWTITLYDRDTGRRADLREDSTFVFAIAEDHTAPAPQGGVARIDARARFNVQVAAGGRHVPGPEAPPDEFVLAQNYPNPFNPVTTIRYALPAASHVQIDVFDMLGRRVVQLVNGTEKAGWHEVRWDAGHLPSGLYVYRLSLGETALVKTMMLLR